MYIEKAPQYGADWEHVLNHALGPGQGKIYIPPREEMRFKFLSKKSRIVRDQGPTIPLEDIQSVKLGSKSLLLSPSDGSIQGTNVLESAKF